MKWKCSTTAHTQKAFRFLIIPNCFPPHFSRRSSSAARFTSLRTPHTRTSSIPPHHRASTSTTGDDTRSSRPRNRGHRVFASGSSKPPTRHPSSRTTSSYYKPPFASFRLPHPRSAGLTSPNKRCPRTTAHATTPTSKATKQFPTPIVPNLSLPSPPSPCFPPTHLAVLLKQPPTPQRSKDSQPCRPESPRH